MANDTRKCNSCAMTLPADATVCSDCGAKQRTEPDALSSFALADDDDRGATPAGRTPSKPAPSKPAPSTPATSQPFSAPASSPPGDALELDLGAEEALAEEAGAEEGGAAQDDAKEGGADEIVLEDLSETPPAPAPKSEPEPKAAPEEDEESAQTGETVRMSMHDVVAAWNEEAVPEGAAPPETTTLGEAKGLPKGFWAAVVACVLIVTSLILLLS